MAMSLDTFEAELQHFHQRMQHPDRKLAIHQPWYQGVHI